MRVSVRCFLCGIGLVFAGSGHLEANQLPLYLERMDGLQLEKQQNFLGALVRFQVLLVLLENLHEENPAWETGLVMKDIADSQAKIATLKPLAAKQILDKRQTPLSSGAPLSALYDDGAKEPDALKAMHEIEEYRSRLELAHEADPQWEAGVIEDRIKKSQELIKQLAARVIKESMPPSGDGHTVQ